MLQQSTFAGATKMFCLFSKYTTQCGSSPTFGTKLNVTKPMMIEEIYPSARNQYALYLLKHPYGYLRPKHEAAIPTSILSWTLISPWVSRAVGRLFVKVCDLLKPKAPFQYPRLKIEESDK